jgi:hypothetical protein
MLIQEWKEKEREKRATFEVVLMENSPKLMSDNKLEIEEIWRMPRKTNAKQTKINTKQQKSYT